MEEKDGEWDRRQQKGRRNTQKDGKGRKVRINRRMRKEGKEESTEGWERKERC